VQVAEHQCKSRQRQCRKHQSEVAERDVIEARHEQQVEDDAGQPRRDDISTDVRP
jgi:hypothetical protein